MEAQASPLWLEQADLAARVAVGRLEGRYRGDHDDLVQIARLAAWQANERWRPGGLNRRGWVYMRARGAVVDALRTSDYGSQLGRPELRLLRELARGEIDDLPHWFPRQPRLSLYARVGGREDDGDAPYLLDILASGGTPEGELDRVCDLSAIDETLARIPKREAALIALRYVDGHTLVDLSEAFGISPGRVSQLITRGLDRLRADVADDDRDGWLDRTAA